MAKKISIDSFRQPSLFDDFGPVTQASESSMPVHPEIERLARQKAAESNQMPFGPVIAQPVPNKFVFMSLGSGSSGNCSYIGDSRSGFLVDAGVDAGKVTEALHARNIPMSHVKGICITHDHSDHMRYVYPLLRHNKHMRLYCTPRTLAGILRRHNVSRRLKDYQINIYKEIPFEIDNFTITAFEVQHDGTDNAGFHIQHDDRAMTIATDLGCISARVDHYMRQTDYMVIESNYDLNMLRFGPYPEYLKARIRACNGHMDNAETAKYLAEIHTPRLKYIFLCHLSQDNNSPETALAEVSKALQERGLKIGAAQGTPSDMEADVQLVALPRFDPSPLYTFRP